MTKYESSLFRKLYLSFFVTLIIFFQSNAFAENDRFPPAVSGNLLLSTCESSDKVLIYSCKIYIQGSIDQIWEQMTLEFGDETLICVWKQNQGVTPNQMQKVVIKTLKDHPEELHYNASGLIYSAIMDNFINMHDDSLRQCITKYKLSHLSDEELKKIAGSPEQG